MKNVITELFSESVNQYPNRAALEIGGQGYSYQHLASLVESVINNLQQQQIKGKAVVVLNDHSIYTYASLLAINFSGNTILPLEASWPRQRIEHILEQAKPAAFIKTCSDVENHLVDQFTNLTNIDAATGLVAVPEEVQNETTDYNNIAYIIFTSGTTGVPKGVPVKQESLNAFISYYKEQYDFTPNDRFLQVYELTFDVAYFSFLMPVCCGACCCILSAKKSVPKYLFIVDDLIKHHITVVSMVPTVLHFIKKYLKDLKAPALRYSFFSGDALYHSDAIEWQQFAENAAIHNFYGPTETTIVCTRYIWDKNASAEESYNDIVSLGVPFPGMSYQIVDENNNEVNEGEVGELSFSGIQVIDAYLNNSHSEKFFETVEGGQKKRYYKTGDLASVNENGNLVFHGRTDLQVKINGYRVELEEVEWALHNVIQQKSIVVKKRNSQNAVFLKAYIEGEEQNIDQLKVDLLQYLPAYMIPAHFEFIERIPLSPNGKIDKVYLQSI